MAIRKLTPAIHEKVWGSPETQPWLANPEGRKIGEIWFSAPEAMPVLVKLLFTTERLSVQVHPDDAYARAHGETRGKTEMWHILRAEPDATIALGPRRTVTKQQLGEAALTGEIVALLDWVSARAGDTFFVPAGTIHAIGGGLTLCEIQQLSDVTYRLFDYHRKPARPLHLDDSLAVARLEPFDGRMLPRSMESGRDLLAECSYFRTERLEVQGTSKCPALERPSMYVAIGGEGQIAGQGFHAGEAFVADADSDLFTIDASAATFIIASA